MSLAATAANVPARRRTRAAAESTLVVDSRHRRSTARRQAKATGDNPAMHYGWPEGFVPTGIVVTMLSITVLHHRALLDALFSLLPF